MALFLRHFCIDGITARDTRRLTGTLQHAEHTLLEFLPNVWSEAACFLAFFHALCSLIKAIKKDIQCPPKLADNAFERVNTYKGDGSRQAS